MRLLPALLALLLATPVAAQDALAQYEAAARAFYLPGVESLAMGDAIDDDAILALLPSLEGRWMPATALFPYPQGFDPDLLNEACGRIAWTLEPTAPRSFGLRRTVRRDGAEHPLTVRYDWMTGNTFDRGVSEAELIPFMGLDAADEVASAHLLAAGMRGHAMLFHPSPDALVIVAAGLPAEILLRCP